MLAMNIQSLLHLYNRLMLATVCILLAVLASVYGTCPKVYKVLSSKDKYNISYIHDVHFTACHDKASIIKDMFIMCHSITNPWEVGCWERQVLHGSSLVIEWLSEWPWGKSPLLHLSQPHPLWKQKQDLGQTIPVQVHYLLLLLLVNVNTVQDKYHFLDPTSGM